MDMMSNVWKQLPTYSHTHFQGKTRLNQPFRLRDKLPNEASKKFRIAFAITTSTLLVLEIRLDISMGALNSS